MKYILTFRAVYKLTSKCFLTLIHNFIQDCVITINLQSPSNRLIGCDATLYTELKPYDPFTSWKETSFYKPNLVIEHEPYPSLEFD